MRSWLERVLAGSRWRLALEAWAIVVVAAALWQIVTKVHLYQWDVIVYWWAGRAFAHGQSPYGAIPGQPEYLHFVYPPIVAPLFAPLAILKPSIAKLLWITLKALAFWLTVRLWRLAIGAEQQAVPPVFFFTFAFGSALLVDFTAGNIAVFEQLVLWLGFAALLTGRRWTFALLVVLAAQCKLTPVFFLGLLLVVDERPHWKPFIGGTALMAALVGANVVLFPAQTREFRAGVSSLAERGWGDPSTLGVMQDLVDQLRGLTLPLPEATAYVLYLVAVVFILVQTLRWWRTQRVAGKARPVEIVLVTLATYALVMPRMKDYSYVALLPVAWYALAGRQAVTASIAVLAVLVPRPLPQLKLWLPLVPQPYVYAPLLAALVLWTMLTAVDRDARADGRAPEAENDRMPAGPRAISAA
jgi:Glycosyltransferase family 87